MPWKVSDVDRFKKGLSPAQKKRWVEVANSVLTKCRAEGGSNCEASAIRQANGVVKTNIDMIQLAVNKSNQVAYEPTIVTVDNKKSYYAVPVVMMVEGVHNGSAGPVFHSAEEFGKSVDAWDGMPVTIHHPMVDDSFVSVNTEGVEELYVVGFVTSPLMKDNKLTATVYLDVQRLAAVSPDTLLNVANGQMMEVSVGVFTEDEEIEGNWNGETFYRIARNHVPDHLAILPGEIGACSLNDGCGLRVNKKGGTNVIEVNDKFLKDLTLQGYSAMMIIQSEGLQERLDKVRQSLYSRDSDAAEYYVEEVFDNYAIFRLHTRVKEGEYWKTTGVQLLKQMYQLNADGTVEWVGEPVKVVRNIEYVQVNNENKSKMCEPCKERVNELIAHAGTHFDETDREWLEALTEDKLDKLTPKKIEVNTAVPTFEDAVKVVQANAKSLDDYVKILPEEVKAEVEVSLAAFKEKKSAIVASIQANTEKDTWTGDELNAMSIEVLQKIEKSVKKVVEEQQDFSINKAKGGQNTKGVVPLMLP